MLINKSPNIFNTNSKAKNLFSFSIKWLRQEAKSILDWEMISNQALKQTTQPKIISALRQIG